VAAGCAPPSPHESLEPRRPNILFLYADDMGAWALGGLGNPQAHTPHLDRIAREGVALTSAFVTTPVCSPARASLLASRYGSELGITDYLQPERDAERGLDPAVVTWPERLQAAGYDTALFGKWHVGGADRYHPTRTGYGLFAGWRYGAGTSLNPVMEVDGREQPMTGYTPDLLADRAIEFLRRPREAPFLLSVHFWAPHANTENRTPDGDRTWLPLSDDDWSGFRDLDPALPEPDYPKLDTPRAKRMLREYLASVASLDRNAGRILRALDELGIAEDTVVVFTSDHGYNLGHHGIWHKGNGRWLLVDERGPRPNLWDRSLRVPALVRWPAALPAGARVDSVVTSLDWYPTLLELAGLEPPAGESLRGRSLLPLLRGEHPAWDEDFYAEYDLNHAGVHADLRGWRTREWKLVLDRANPGRDELYHLSRDPDEQHNLIADPGEEARSARERLERLIRERMAAIGSPAPGAGS
jgi:uncharacterized sulfatase